MESEYDNCFFLLDVNVKLLNNNFVIGAFFEENFLGAWLILIISVIAEKKLNSLLLRLYRTDPTMYPLVILLCMLNRVFRHTFFRKIYLLKSIHL